MTDNIRFLDRKTARQAREDQGYGYIFPLTMTGGSFARVRVPNLNDRVFLDQLPTSAQTIISESLLDVENQNRQKSGTEDTRPRTTKEVWRKFVDVVSDQEDAANELVVKCFLEPRVVMNEQDADPNDDGVVVVTEIHLEDRLTFLAICLAGEGEAARKLKLFRESLADVPRQSRDEKTATPKRISGTRSERLVDGGTG